jgi:two-component system OmpR family response regulator
VWGYKRPVATRTVDAHNALLRGKLEADPASPRHILTVRKAGYRIDQRPPS